MFRNTGNIPQENLNDLIQQRNELIKQQREEKNLVEKLKIVSEISKLERKIFSTDLNKH